jgi:predicted enzyme related to lactoylglutathione lyase
VIRPRTYPTGVPCWVDTEQPDPKAACRFYGQLFGWTFADAVPAEAPGSYLIASLDRRDAAAVAPGAETPVTWNTYVAVDDADAAAVAVAAAGGTVVSEPADAGDGGRAAICTDSAGAAFRLWQARNRPGAQVVNAPGAWNFSHLHTDRPDVARAFYADVFGWETMDAGGGAVMWRQPGYGDHLEATVDPDIRTRQAHAPDGFEDVVAGLVATADGAAPRWSVVFTVADRDDAVVVAQGLGAEVLSTEETMWTREAVIRDPQGAELTLSQFAPPEDWG